MNKKSKKITFYFISVLVVTLTVIILPSVEPQYSYGGEFTSGPGGEFLLNNLIFLVLTIFALVQTIVLVDDYIIEKNSKKIRNKRSSLVISALKLLATIAFIILGFSLPYILILALFSESKPVCVLIDLILLAITSFLYFRKVRDNIDK